MSQFETHSILPIESIDHGLDHITTAWEKYFVLVVGRSELNIIY